MSYNPNNTPVYLRAYAGYLAGITAASVSDTAQGDYTLYTQTADAWAQAVDTVFGVSGPTNFQLEAIQEIAESIWRGRSPSGGILPAAYTQTAQSLVARVLQGNAQIVAEGIDPNNTGGGAEGGTVTRVTGAAPIVATPGMAGATTYNIAISPATDATAGSLSAADKTKLDGLTPGAAVASVGATLPVTSTGGTTPVIGINPATDAAAGSLSAADKTKLDGITPGAAVAAVTGTAPITSSGGTTPAISITPATDIAAGSMSAADKTKLDGITPGAAVAAVGATAPLASSGGATPTVSYTAGTGSGLVHQTAGTADVAAVHGAAPGQVPVTNAGVTDAIFGFIFGTWTATVNNAASPFSPGAGQIMIAVDTSGGAVVINTPAAPTDGQIFFVKPVVASATPITVTAVGGATIENPSNACSFGASGTVPGQGGGVGWKYQASQTRWVGFTGF